MNTTRSNLKDTILAQYARLANSILNARDQADLERIQQAVDAITPLWTVLNQAHRLRSLRARIRRRAVYLLLDHEDTLSLYRPGKGLWESAKKSIRGLQQLITN